MKDEEAWIKLHSEFDRLSVEYAELKNRPKDFETEMEKESRTDEIRKDRNAKRKEYEALEPDFEKRRDYIRNLKREVETMRVTARKDELIQKLKSQTITEKELLELQVLATLY